MTLKAYLDHIQAQTGKTSEDFRALAEKKGLLKEGVKTGEIVTWLKQDYGLGHGHAMAIVLMLKSATEPRVPRHEKIAGHFKGKKARWRGPYDQLLADVREFGPEMSVTPTDSYISLLRKGRKFAIVQVTMERMDLGIKLKGAKSTKRFAPAGKWNAMVTHRVQIRDPKQVDQELLTWLKRAYEAA